MKCSYFSRLFFNQYILFNVLLAIILKFTSNITNKNSIKLLMKQKYCDCGRIPIIYKYNLQ